MKPFFLVGALLAAPVWAQNAVTVRVVDAQNKPIAGAGVEVRLWREDPKPSTPILTKSNGAAMLSLPSDGDGKPMRASITVAAKGFAFASVAVTGQSVEVQLKKGATWRSQVVDNAGKPIAGAKISVQAVLKGDDFRSLTFLRNTRAAEKYVAQSGADGRFQIADLPADMDLIFRVTHPRYAVGSGQDAPGPSGEIIKLALGGGLRGRLLDVAGKPLSQTKVYASQPNGAGGWSEDITDQTGSFTLESMAAGQYRVGAQLERGAKFVVARVHPVRVVAGKVTAVPVMRAVVGKEIRGVVRDALTKKPLPGASVMATQNNDTSAYTTSDTAGAWVLRVVPGKYQVHMSGAPQGYLRSGMQPTVETSATASNVVFDLKKATVISGLTVDEAGKPIAARLTLHMGQEINSDAEGRWKFTPHDNEALSFGGGAADDGYFEVVGPNKWEMPIRSAVVVRVRKKAWSSLSGRAVAPDGTPLAGIKITASFLVPMGDGMSLGDSQSAVSDAQGRFVVSKIRAGRDLKISGQKEGFTPQNSGVITQTGTSWTTSDLIFAALNRRIEGTTTPGARVVAAGREVVADASGKFRMEGLPSGEIPVFAAKNGQFGSAVAKSEAPLLLSLRPATLQGRDEALAAQFVAEALREPKADKKHIEQWLSNPEGTLGFEAALQKAAQVPAGERSTIIEAAIAAWKAGDSVAALQKGIESLDDSELRTHQLLVAALKTKEAALSRRALEEAETTFATAEKYLFTRESSLYLAAIMAERVSGEAAGFAALDRALAFTIKNHGEKTVVIGAMQTETGRDQVMAEHAEVVAAGSPALLRRLLEAI
ncbi:MAG TPA: carboxypeptidase-like regulatory domain-containing protein, partial [Abditibacterium sp.]